MTKVKVAKKSQPSTKPSKKSSSAGGIPAHVTILNTIAFQKIRFKKESVERKQLPSLTHIKGKSTIANGLTKLKNAGWITFTSQDVTITDLGMDNVDMTALDNVKPPATNKEHIEAVIEDHSQIKSKEKAMGLIKIIIDGRRYQKKDIAEELGMKMNSTFANLLTSLKKANIAEYDKETIRLTDEMFVCKPRVE